MSRANPHANRGVARNKRPLQNIVYKIETNKAGAFVLLWTYERDHNRKNGGFWYFHGTVTEEEIRLRLTPRQWSKFRQGERTFIRQRRVDGRNIPPQTDSGNPVPDHRE